ncbi:MAG: 8-oxo-dGTP diphosphatase MutT [Candidatus Omnitrophica bacterium]|nr:8-oxo-dGTP diphosphatase MutT [Candidatus Omnitrophota bacterium]
MTEEAGVVPCGVGVIRREREFLIAQRCAEDTFAHFWEFPGGKKNPGESFEECVARELKEELGIEVRVREKLMDIRKVLDNKIIWLNFYLCEHLSGEPRAIECQNVRWVDVRALKNYAFPPANEIVIDRLIETYA